jgi:hypothetical protein
MFSFLQFYCSGCNEWFTQMQRVAFLLLYETYLITRNKIQAKYWTQTNAYREIRKSD